MKLPNVLIILLALSLTFTSNCKRASSTQAQILQISHETKDVDLVKAVKDKDHSKVKELLEGGANPNAFYQLNKDSNTYVTVLGNAVNEKQLEIARLLLEGGASVDKNFFTKDENEKEDYAGLNFKRAVENQDVPMMKLLIEFQADLDKNTEFLPIIFEAKTKEVLDLLIDSGFDINQLDSDGYTRLMMASYENDSELVRAILQFNPKLDVVSKPLKYYNNQKLTALGLAKISRYTDKIEIAKQKEVIKMLKEAGAKK